MMTTQASACTSSPNGTKPTVAELARVKALPFEFLADDLEVEDVAQGVLIPYYDCTGELITKRSRTAIVAKDGSKWRNGQKAVAYGSWRIHEANKAGFLIIVEGESDCWTLWFHGLPALGLPGASTASTLASEHVEGVGAIYISHESDTGGDTCIKKVPVRLRELGFGGKVYDMRMPDGFKDPSDLHINNPDEFLSRFQRSIETAVRLGRQKECESRARTAPQAASEVKAPAKDIILAHFRQTYRPVFRRGEVVYSDTLGREIKRSEACFGADSTLLAALGDAADAPRAEDGTLKTRMLPKLFKDFAPTAWKDMIAAVHVEEHGDEVIELAQEEFAAKIAAALNRNVALGRAYEDGKETHTATENRSLIHWCEVWAKTGQWGQIRSFRLWARRNERGQLEIAPHPTLFAQIGMAELA
jgi:hypothetical protein